MELRLSPFDPLALLDEIERLVRVQIGPREFVRRNPSATEPGAGLVQISAPGDAGAVVPAHDTLSLQNAGNYSSALSELKQHQAHDVAASAAD